MKPADSRMIDSELQLFCLQQQHDYRKARNVEKNSNYFLRVRKQEFTDMFMH